MAQEELSGRCDTVTGTRKQRGWSMAKAPGGTRKRKGRSAGQTRVPGIAGGAEYVVDGIAAGAELRRIRLGNDDCPVGLQSLDHDVGAIRYPVGKDARALGPPHPCDCSEVLDHDRQSIKDSWTALARGRASRTQ